MSIVPFNDVADAPAFHYYCRTKGVEFVWLFLKCRASSICGRFWRDINMLLFFQSGIHSWRRWYSHYVRGGHTYNLGNDAIWISNWWKARRDLWENYAFFILPKLRLPHWRRWVLSVSSVLSHRAKAHILRRCLWYILSFDAPFISFISIYTARPCKRHAYHSLPCRIEFLFILRQKCPPDGRCELNDYFRLARARRCSKMLDGISLYACISCCTTRPAASCCQSAAFDNVGWALPILARPSNSTLVSINVSSRYGAPDWPLATSRFSRLRFFKYRLPRKRYYVLPTPFKWVTSIPDFRRRLTHGRSTHFTAFISVSGLPAGAPAKVQSR